MTPFSPAKVIIACMFVFAGCNQADTISKVSFDTPITLISNEDEDATDYDKGLVNYCSVVKLSDSLYYLYYSAYGQDNKFNDYAQTICMAYSTDGFHYTRGIPEGIEPPFPGTNVISAGGLVEMDVCLVDDENFPFRMVSSLNDPPLKNVATLFRSADGVHFDKLKNLSGEYNDTQSSIINRGDSLKIYVRGHFDDWRRAVSVVTCDLQGNVLSPQSLILDIPDDHLYTSAASDLDGVGEILFPTLYVPETSFETLQCYVVKGREFRKIDIDTSTLLSDKDLQVYASPGLVTIGNDKYLVFATRDSDHEHFDPHTTYSRIRMAKVRME